MSGQAGRKAPHPASTEKEKHHGNHHRSHRGGQPDPRVESSRSAVPASRLIRFSDPLPEPDVRLPPHPALHEPRWSTFSHRPNPSVPRRGDLRSSVAIPADRNRPRIEEDHPVLLWPPPVAEIATSQVLPSTAAELSAKPSVDPEPRVVAQVSAGRLRYAVLEVRGPTPQHPVELMQEVREGFARSLLGDRLHLGHDRGQ